MFRKLFGAGGGETPPPAPEYPWELKSGDFLKLRGHRARGSFGGGTSGRLGPRARPRGTTYGPPGADRRNRRTVRSFCFGKATMGRSRSPARSCGPLSNRSSTSRKSAPCSSRTARRCRSSTGGRNRSSSRVGPPRSTARRSRSKPTGTTTIPRKRRSDRTSPTMPQSFDFYRLVGDKRQFALEAMVLDGGPHQHLSDLLPVDLDG